MSLGPSMIPRLTLSHGIIDRGLLVHFQWCWEPCNKYDLSKLGWGGGTGGGIGKG